MQRPYIFCHMLTSLDGKIIGNFLDIPECKPAHEAFRDIMFNRRGNYRMQGWLSGRLTTDYNFTFDRKPDLDENAAPVPAGDYVPEIDVPMFYVSIDPDGRLGWESKYLSWSDANTPVIEVLTEKASNAYKTFLRRLGIPYIICGKDEIDHALTLHKLRTLFGIEHLMLGGGGILNWSYIQAGLCDELSLVVAPSADGADKPTLFMAKEKYGTDDTPVGFELLDVEKLDGGVLWLKYRVKNARS